MTSRLETIQDFLILPIYISPNSIHYIFFKKHTSSKPDFIKDQTLFLLNIPVDTCTHHLDRLFRNCGDIKHVVYSTPTSTSSSLWLPFKTGSSCHVVFTSSDAVDKALSMLSRKRVWTIDEDVPEPRLYGIEKWNKAYFECRPSVQELNDRVEKHLKSFDDMQEEKRARLLAMRNQPDEDGFIKVISKSKSIFEDIEGKPKKKAKELKDFYRFQMRDTKKQQLIDLRIKFEKDKQRVEKAKQVRKFKPY